MGTFEQEVVLKHMARRLIIPTIKDWYGKDFGFFLSIFKFNEVGVSDYISNGQRVDMILMLRELADRLESGEHFQSIVGGSDD